MLIELFPGLIEVQSCLEKLPQCLLSVLRINFETHLSVVCVVVFVCVSSSVYVHCGLMWHGYVCISCLNLCVCCSLSAVPRGVIQNGARVRSQALFPVIRPLPVSPVGSRTSAIRLVAFAPITLNHVINVSQGFPSANTFPHRHTQTHPHAHIQ